MQWSDEQFMDLAIVEAGKAEGLGEVPVGALIVNHDGEIVSVGHNQPVSGGDPTAHAEIIAMRDAARRIGNYRLTGLTLYCTLEPCPMCAGAMVYSRIKRLVYGAPDGRAGAAGSLYNVVDDPRLNHRLEISRGVRGEECSALLKRFFELRRAARERS
jgi:tRNA(adenine34) deaminase